jgi:phage shock protein PspC (stress-responsive transcriptional regulator)
MVPREIASDHWDMTSDSSFTTPRPLLRSAADKKLGGVAGGLGRYFGLDPVLFRVGFVAAAVLSGVGLLAYLILWAIVPRDDAAQAASSAQPVAV